MTALDDTDRIITAWLAASAPAGGSDNLGAILAAADRVPQRRHLAWLRAPWRPAPDHAPFARTSVILVGAALLVAALVSALLLAGSRPPVPAPFRLQGMVAVPGATGAIRLAAGPDVLWATGDGAVARIDPVTNEVTMLPVPIAAAGFTGILERDGMLWAADYHGNRVLRVDLASGEVAGEIRTATPDSLRWAEGIWALTGRAGGLVRIDPETDSIDLRFPTATSYAVAAGSLWYLETADREATAVEIDPATGIERSRVSLPYAAAGSLAVDTHGNVYAWRSGTATASRVTVVDGATHAVMPAYSLPHDLIGGLVQIGDTMWGVAGPQADGRSRLAELSAAGPTGREADLALGLDPDGPVVAFGSVWIPWDGRAGVYRYTAEPLAP